MSVALIRLTLMVTVLAVAAGCGRSADETENAGGSSQEAAALEYPAPRWPSYFQPPKSVEDLMPAARSLVRNTSGFQGKGMGILEAGDHVLIVPTPSADPMVVDAIKRALVERKVTPHIKYTNEFTRRERRGERARRRAERAGRDIEKAGIYQASAWITGQFPDPERAEEVAQGAAPGSLRGAVPRRSRGGTGPRQQRGPRDRPARAATQRT